MRVLLAVALLAVRCSRADISSRQFADFFRNGLSMTEGDAMIDEYGDGKIRSGLGAHGYCSGTGKKNPEMLRGLLEVYQEAEIDPNMRDEDGLTSLHHCITNDYHTAELEHLRLLIEFGADVDLMTIPIPGNSQTTVRRVTPLQLAIMNNKPGAVEVLLAAGADPNLVGDAGTALHLAAMHNRPKLVDMLIELSPLGVDIDARIPSESRMMAGWTPLFLAVEMKHKRVIETLTKHGADWDVENAEGTSAADIGPTFGMPRDKFEHLNKNKKPAPPVEPGEFWDSFWDTGGVLATLAGLVINAISMKLWKRRASERAERELLDDLAPPAQTRRGRASAVADAASVPVWADVFRVAVCGIVIIHLVHLAHSAAVDEKVSLLAILVAWSFFLWHGFRIICKRFARDKIWGRVKTDACWLLWIITLSNALRRFDPVKDTNSSSVLFLVALSWLTCLIPLLGACVLAFDGFGWLRRLLVHKSGLDAKRAASELEREAVVREKASKRGDRAGVRRRANRGRRRDATRARDPTPDVQEPALETTAPEPADAPESKASPGPEPAPTRAEPRAPSVAAPVPEAKTEEPVAPEARSEEPLRREESAAAPEGFEIVARVLEHLGESHLLPRFEAEEISDNVLPCLDPADLISIGVSQMTCLAILAAAHSAAKSKSLETQDILDNVARHQSVLEEELREHRAEIARLRIRELPEDLCCSITCEIMKDPVLCVGDGHTYERVAIEQWLATGRGTSPATNEPLESTSLVTNHTVKKLIAALLEEHRGGASRG